MRKQPEIALPGKALEGRLRNLKQQDAIQCPENLRMRRQPEIALPGKALEGRLRNLK